MKIKQRVEMVYHHVYVSYNGIELTDAEGNEVFIKMTDDNHIHLHEQTEYKVKRINKERQEAAEELLSQTLESEDE
jgi:uncharacterized membrane-anchored protein